MFGRENGEPGWRFALIGLGSDVFVAKMRVQNGVADEWANSGCFSFFGDIEKGFRNKGGRKKCFFAPKTDAEMVAFGVPKIEIVPIFSQYSSLHALYNIRESVSYGKS